jgi:hypothetical protein
VVIVICEIGTLVVYVISIAFLGSIIQTSHLTLFFLGKVLSITLVAWLPFVVFDVIYHRFSPTMLDKLKVEARAKSKLKPEENLSYSGTPISLPILTLEPEVRSHEPKVRSRRSSTSSQGYSENGMSVKSTSNGLY